MGTQLVHPDLMAGFVRAIDACARLYQTHARDLAYAHGRASERVNPMGDMPYRFDVETEAAVLAALKATNFTFVVTSEEHGRMCLNCDAETHAEFLLVLDGWDGSSHRLAHFKQHGSLEGLRGGPMFAVFAKGVQARYKDALLAAVVEPGIQTALFAVAGRRTYKLPLRESFLRTLADRVGSAGPQDVWEDLNDIVLGRSDVISERLHRSSEISVDLGIDGVAQIFGILPGFVGREPMRRVFWDRLEALDCPLQPVDHEACVTNLARLFLDHGSRLFSCTGTRKGNLELAVAWLLLERAGGCMPYLWTSFGSAGLSSHFFDDHLVLKFAQYRRVDGEIQDICLPVLFLAAGRTEADVVVSFFDR
ncbi:MAG: hypothetical protein KC925_02175 [Candidatus Doudnabacteria bacterium]|nr:hypothetical protein [Candidatus Doudnabacteria bacterium]